MIVTCHQAQTQLYLDAILRKIAQTAKKCRYLPENWSHLLEIDFPELPSRHMEVPYADD